jgi:glucose/mannose-6-phosphate isomerase
VAEDGRPRALLVAGVGGSGQAGDVLSAVLGSGAPVPLVQVRSPVLPGWIGPMDLVLGVSCSGTTEEVLAVVDEADRRGCRLVTVGEAGSPLAQRAEQSRCVHVPVDPHGGPPRANLWSLAVPLLLVADALGLASVPAQTLTVVADRLDRLAEECGPARESFENRAKALALEMSGHLPVVWGSGEVAVAAAYRFACQLHENAKLPAVFGAFPEATHNQIAAFDGPLGRDGLAVTDSAGEGSDDFFRDRVTMPGRTRMQVVLLRDRGEHPRVAARADALDPLAAARGVPLRVLWAEGESPLERLASLIGLADFATVYLALASGVDPTPIDPITDLKERISAVMTS